MPNTTVRFGFALEYVPDVATARRFFVDVLGLEVERDHPTFIQFKAKDGARYAIASDQPMDQTGGPELWWLVDDVNAAFTTPRNIRRVNIDRSSGESTPARRVFPPNNERIGSIAIVPPLTMPLHREPASAQKRSPRRRSAVGHPNRP